MGAIRRELLEGALPHRSRYTRQTIVEFIQRWLTGWKPPAWVCADYERAGQDFAPEDLQALLLLHVTLQDTLLYDVLQTLIAPRSLQRSLSATPHTFLA
jgi:hypothetical protein